MARTLVKFSVKILLLVLLLVLTLLAGKGAFGAIATKHHDNSTGFVMQQTNPNTYVEGYIRDFARVGPGLNIRIQPRGMYSLFDQNILFCDIDNVAAKFDKDLHGVVVLTYETRAHRTIEGIGCHELMFVDEVKGGTHEKIN